MTATTGEIAYYIDRWNDEGSPCYPSLQAWADWLSLPAPEFGRPEAAKPGDTFPASTLEFRDDVIATRDADGCWRFDREPRMTSDEDAREWHGHVTPAIARFRAALGEKR